MEELLPDFALPELLAEADMLLLEPDFILLAEADILLFEELLPLQELPAEADILLPEQDFGLPEVDLLLFELLPDFALLEFCAEADMLPVLHDFGLVGALVFAASEFDAEVALHPLHDCAPSAEYDLLAEAFPLVFLCFPNPNIFDVPPFLCTSSMCGRFENIHTYLASFKMAAISSAPNFFSPPILFRFTMAFCAICSISVSDGCNFKWLIRTGIPICL